MTKLLQSLLVWLMLVAIPFQGFATAGMLTCATVQADVQAMMTPEHCAMMEMGMQPDEATGDDASAYATTHASTPATAHHHAAGKCGTCASCFGAVMIPSTALTRVPGETATLAAFPFESGRVARVDLALPERPPKASLA